MPGPSQIPQECLDVYLGPFMDELKTLWRGVNAFDGSRTVGSTGPEPFKLFAALFCTMHDWPGMLQSFDAIPHSETGLAHALVDKICEVSAITLSNRVVTGDDRKRILRGLDSRWSPWMPHVPR